MPASRLPEWMRRIAAAEASWPSHEHDVTMTQLPDYLLRRAAAADDLEAEATEWRRQYLENDVVQLQLLKQHHYHPYNEVTQERVPLAGCQKSDRPGLCKSDFSSHPVALLRSNRVMPLQTPIAWYACWRTEKSFRSFTWSLRARVVEWLCTGHVSRIARCQL